MSTESKGLVPPHDIEAEMCVLGAILLDPLVLGEVSEILEAEDFYREVHRKLYEEILKLQANDLEPDLVSLSSSLSHSGDLEKLGGKSYLVELIDLLPSTVGAPSYARIVRGHALRRRLARAADGIRLDALEGTDAVGKIIDRAESQIFDIGSKEGARKAVFVGDILEKTFEKIEELQRQSGSLTGLDTGYFRLNTLTGGLQGGEMIVVAARPSMGKTTFALNMARNACLSQGSKVLFFSLEMGEEQIVQNILCAEARVDATKIRNAEMSDRDWARLSDAAGRLHESRFLIDATAGLTPLGIRSKARRASITMGGIDLVIIDYLQLVSMPGRVESRQQEISSISRSLKALARELDCPVIAISQLNRSVDSREDHRPRLSDLRESGAIEQDADVIMFLYREDYYEPDKESDAAGSVTEILVAKHRNGPTGMVKLVFLNACLRFENLAVESEHS